ncbi:hypothetical protein K438DRAFT_1761132 [Mycena galopus ATCC 62051]|nr:hypothetical protein K438DRAFT_1761132 [Mycena galopus ATCC 62051]
MYSCRNSFPSHHGVLASDEANDSEPKPGPEHDPTLCASSALNACLWIFEKAGFANHAEIPKSEDRKLIETITDHGAGRPKTLLFTVKFSAFKQTEWNAVLELNLLFAERMHQSDKGLD